MWVWFNWFSAPQIRFSAHFHTLIDVKNNRNDISIATMIRIKATAVLHWATALGTPLCPEKESAENKNRPLLCFALNLMSSGLHITSKLNYIVNNKQLKRFQDTNSMRVAKTEMDTFHSITWISFDFLLGKVALLNLSDDIITLTNVRRTYAQFSRWCFV